MWRYLHLTLRHCSSSSINTHCYDLYIYKWSLMVLCLWACTYMHVCASEMTRVCCCQGPSCSPWTSQSAWTQARCFSSDVTVPWLTGWWEGFTRSPGGKTLPCSFKSINTLRRAHTPSRSFPESIWCEKWKWLFISLGSTFFFFLRKKVLE